MKGFILFARCCPWLIFGVPLGGEAQTTHSYPDYVVIGAFAKQTNAVRFTRDANKNNFSAHFEMNPLRNLYYVHVLTTWEHATAVAYALKLRTETKYFDTWVYSGPLGELRPGDTAFDARDLNPVTDRKMDNVPPEPGGGAREYTDSTSRPTLSHKQGPAVPGADLAAVRKGAADSTGKESTARDVSTAETTMVPSAVPKRTTDDPLTSDEVVGKNFFFTLYRADNHRVVEGEVDAIDFEKSRKMATYAANAPVKVLLPSGKSKQITFVCHVFGYRKLQKEFDPANPSPDLYLDEQGNLVMPFELLRLQKGDIAIMYNVFFFKDAAVMRPESRYEVNNLLELLVENPEYRIKIHGHTNGNAAGKIIRMGKADGFYSLADTKQGFGSAKKLSEERALVIRDYLVSSGISPDRMEIKAWGGKKPLFDKNSARAIENVRVEIEILSE